VRVAVLSLRASNTNGSPRELTQRAVLLHDVFPGVLRVGLSL
jgi:hypothetical protein